MYTFFYRSALFPMLATFDTPDLSQVCTARVRSNTPLQSLTLSNDEGIFELAQALAARTLRESRGTDRERITHLFRLAMARPPATDESERLHGFYQAQLQDFESDVAAASKIAGEAGDVAENYAQAAAWTSTARAIINLDEFITRE